MAQLFPTYDKINELKVKPEPGELYLLQFLRDNLDDTFEVYFQPFLNGDRPDIIIMRKNAGVLIIEVKDWELKYHELDNRRKWKVKNKQNAYTKSPIDQVLQYKENMYNLHIDNLLEYKIKNFKYWSIVSCAIYFHNETSKSISDFIIKPFKDDKKYQDFLKFNIDFIGYDNVNNADFTELLKKRYLISKFEKSKYFSDELYESFKRYLKPTYHTIDEGKILKYNNQQQKLIISEPREQRVKGVVGSGKTTVLAARAVYAHKRTNDKVLIFTYNITLKNYIHDKISNVRENFDWSVFYITNYHYFITTEFNNLGIEIIIPADFSNWTSEQKSDYFESEYYSNENIFEPYKEQIQKYKTILIDEIQDYKLSWMRIIKKYFLEQQGEYVLFGDEKQNIYDNELDNKDIKTNVQGKPTTMTISNRFGDKIKGIALDFQRKLFVGKYDIDDLTTNQQLAFGGITKYFYIPNSTKVDGILEHIQSISTQLKEHPNDIAILGFTFRLLRQYDCYYRYKTNEKTKTMFETQEVWYKLLLDSYTKDDFVQKGINLFNNSRLRENDEKKSHLAVLICIKQLLDEFNLPAFVNRYDTFISKHNVSKNEFENWYNDNRLKEIIKFSKPFHFAENIKFVRDNKKLHFWFNSGTIKLSTIHSFKGWEASTLFLIIEEKYESGDFQMSFSELIYTGLTRSKNNLIVLNYGNQQYDADLNEIFKIRN